MCFQFLLDEMVQPIESEWFGQYETNSETVLTMRETELYKEDWIGLKAMDENGQLQFLTVEGASIL